ncbi:YciI family protein [Pseudomonas syringae group sp. J254-4]|uniref:YciI family protein n=1 Tax=Pseudomonas syringae group sp. J254-4 TaxID=3079589 RepID=UPI00290CC85D|nr:YciI family protein [Pseudomonas syringae group sp. J254-4]MDU8457266.1 hypothetical protein [Pseudomonas syringae group sp. J254-4]
MFGNSQVISHVSRMGFKMKYYLCKFVPPRADFLSTLSPEEKSLMQLHGDYLNALLEKGVIVAHGPVLEPPMGYGMSLFQIGEDVEIASFTSEDPIVKNGVGHYEHYAMPHLKYRDQEKTSD